MITTYLVIYVISLHPSNDLRWSLVPRRYPERKDPPLIVVNLLQHCPGYKPLAYEDSQCGIQSLGSNYNIT